MVQMSETVNSESHAEQVFYNLHYQASIFYLRHTSSKVRVFLEMFWMLLAISGFAALICLHLAFVYRGNPTPASFSTSISSRRPLRSIPSTCLPSLPGFRRDADVTHIVLLDEGAEESFVWGAETIKGAENNETMVCSAAGNETFLTMSDNALSGLEVYFSFSQTKGFAMLTPSLSCGPSNPYGIAMQIVAISKTDVRCFGETFLQEAVFRLLGPDLVMINWLLAISNGTGYIYNPRKDKIVDVGQHSIIDIRNSHSKGRLNFLSSSIFDITVWRHWFRPWASKVRTAIKTCLIYFVSTNMVSFLLRMAQERLLGLSLQILSHQQENRSILPLFVTHVADCFIFVPITLGVLFFLREFYQGDWVIALTVMTVIFICELFSFVSVRTAQGIFFFPRTFFLLFCLVHFYLFSFPFGFSYVAMWMIVCFMLQCVTFFWNRYEVPAVARSGLVAINPRNRMEYPMTNGDTDVAAHSATQSASPLSASLSRRRGDTESTQSNNSEQILRVSLQQPQIRYTYSSGAFSQGIMSRASSEAIFHADDADDGSESCVYFLGGEVVIRREERRGNSSANTSGESAGELSAQLNRYDSTSTLQSGAAQLGTMIDEDVTSGLQAMHDLTPRLCNLSLPGNLENTNSNSAPVFPVLDSSSSRRRHHDSE